MTILKDSVAPDGSIVRRAISEGTRVQGWSDIAFISWRGEPFGAVFADAVPLSGNNSVMTVAVFDRYPEQLVAMFDLRERQRSSQLAQARFAFRPPQ